MSRVNPGAPRWPPAEAGSHLHLPPSALRRCKLSKGETAETLRTIRNNEGQSQTVTYKTFVSLQVESETCGMLGGKKKTR